SETISADLATLNREKLELAEQFAAVVNEIRMLDNARLSCSLDTSKQCDALRSELARSASPRTASFLSELVELESKARDAVVTRSYQERFTNRRLLSSNEPSVSAHLEALREARRAAEALKLVAADDDDVRRAIDELKSSIPEIESAPYPQS